MIYLIVVALALCVAFYLGIMLGISDCKKQFDIPKGANADEGAWFYYTDLVSEYEVENCGCINA